MTICANLGERVHDGSLQTEPGNKNRSVLELELAEPDAELARTKTGQQMEMLEHPKQI